MSHIGSSPRVVTSKCKIVYQRSKWSVRQFKILNGEVICTVAVLKMNDSLFLWIGNRESDKCKLDEIALGMLRNGENGEKRQAIATTLLGTEGLGTAMARRLAAFLKRPVYVCCGNQYDRFTIPLIEKGLITEIKGRPECF